MTTPAAQFEDIHVQRMPGFELNGFHVSDLSPGINVIHGPNASGKTTLARAIGLLLWPRERASRRALLHARLRTDQDVWTLNLDGTHPSCQSNGTPTEYPVFAPADARPRYILSLHDLLQDDNTAFAQAILTESAGGYDLVEAARTLEFRDRPSNPRSLVDRLKQAHRSLQEARQGQAVLQHDESRLEVLRHERGRAAEAQRQAAVLELAILHARARHEHEAAITALSAFPSGMDRMIGREMDDLADYRGQLDSARHRLQQARHELEQTTTAQSAAKLPPEGVPLSVIETLRHQQNHLQELARDITAAQREQEGAERALAEIRRQLGDAVEDEKLAGLDPVAMDSLADFARQAEELRAKVAAARQAESWFSGDAPPENLESIRRGRDLLSQWLSAAKPRPPGNRRLSSITWGACATLLIVAIGAGVLAHWAWLGAGLIAIALAYLAWRFGARPNATEDPRAIYRQDYQRTGNPEPTRWDTVSVAARMDALSEQYAAGQLLQVRQERRAEEARRIKELQPLMDDLTSRRATIVEQFGVAPSIDESTLHLLANRISRWQEARTNLAAWHARRASAKQQYNGVLAALNETLRTYGYEPGSDVSTIQGAIHDLDRRREAFDDAQRAAKHARRSIHELNDLIQTLETKVETLFADLGLTPNDEATLADWHRRFDSFQEAHRDVDRADAQRTSSEQRLRDHPLFMETLLNQSVDELELHQREAHLKADRHEALSREITAIETRIEDAKQQHDVEEALAAHDQARSELADARERDFHSVAGHLLVEHLRKQHEDRDRPKVFHRARALFADITRGRYRLDIEPGEPPAFRALDTLTQTGHHLDELSSGTRVQLLLAVRVAFVEQQEQGTRLPLVLDETLANSDNERARAIMEAAIRLCRDGRQIFYLTAQDDEVGKWRGLLNEHPDVPLAVIDLAAVRQLDTQATALPIDVQVTSPPPVPEPDDMSHDQYGARLGVPPFDPRAPLGALHLWYLIDDVHVLHRLLSLGVTYWGQFETIGTTGGSSLLSGSGVNPEQVRALADAAETLARDYRVGRGKPVDRATLAASGAVSETFIDEVTALACAVEGDGARLIEALREGKVKRFHAQKTDDLRDFLELHGYVDPAPTFTADELRTRVLAASATDVQAGHVTTEEIDRLLARLTRTAA